MARRYWLFKSEPSAYSYDDLVNDGVAEWDGVRNFQARNLLRDDIKEGDELLFYHSTAKPMAVIGTARVARGGYPDHTAWDPNSEHPDAKSTPDNPIWYMVDIQSQEKFAEPLTLEMLRQVPELKDMMLLRRGSRLSVQPVTQEEWDAVLRLARRSAGR